MKIFKNNDREYRYDPKLWKVVELEENPTSVSCNHTIKYIGPIVDGNIIGEVPNFPLYYETFAGLKELTHLPTGLPTRGTYHCFRDCENLAPTVEEMVAYNNRPSGGWKSIFLFGDCNSQNIIDVDSEYPDGYQALSKLFTRPVDLVESRLKTVLGEATNEQLSKSVSLYDLLNDLSINSIIKIFDALDAGYEDHLVLSTGAVIKYVNVKESSEMQYKAFVVGEKHALAGEYNPVRLTRGIIYCYRLSDNFIVDTEDTRLIEKFGMPLDSVELHKPYKAGHDGFIAVSGVSKIVSGECPIQASGHLIIRGTGALWVESLSDRQACIGTATHDGMSYGRWEPGRDKPLETLTIDGVHVICKSKIPNFSIGSYGTNQMPKINLVNGGTLDCPENNGVRSMIQSGKENLCGSTKRSEPAIYSMNVDKFDSREYLKDYLLILPEASVSACVTKEDCDALLARLGLKE